MKVVQVRHGFATNSSSSHSVVSGTPSWGNLSKQEIVDKFKSDVTDRSFDSGTFTSFDDIVLCGLNAIVYQDEDIFPYQYNQSHVEYDFKVSQSGLSEQLQELLVKAGENCFKGSVPEGDEIYSMYHNSNKTTEENFWDFVYNVTAIEVEDW